MPRKKVAPDVSPPPVPPVVAPSVPSCPPNCVDVQDYGAKCNGVADDTAALRSAIAALSLGGTVRLPVGGLRVTDTVTVPAGVVLFGAARRSSEIVGDFAGPVVCLRGAKSSGLEGLTVRQESISDDAIGVLVEDSGEGYLTTITWCHVLGAGHGRGLVLRGATNYVVADTVRVAWWQYGVSISRGATQGANANMLRSIHVQGCSRVGLEIADCADNRVRDLNVEKCPYGIAGVWIWGARSIGNLLDGVRIGDNEQASGRAAIILDGCRHNEIVGARIGERNTRAVSLLGGARENHVSCTITAKITEPVEYGPGASGNTVSAYTRPDYRINPDQHGWNFAIDRARP